MAAESKVNTDHKVAYMETDCKMSVETSEKTIDITTMDTNDSTPESATKPVIDPRKISEIYVDIEKRLQIASEEMTRDINKVSDILLEFQKELSMPVESRMLVEEPVEISEIIMDMNKDMSGNTHVTSEIEVNMSPITTEQSVSTSQMIAMSAERVTSTASEMVCEKASYFAGHHITQYKSSQTVSMEVNSSVTHGCMDNFPKAGTGPIITELIESDGNDGHSHGGGDDETITDKKTVEETSSSNDAESSVGEVVEKAVDEQSNGNDGSVTEDKNVTEDSSVSKPQESDVMTAVSKVGTNTEKSVPVAKQVAEPATEPATEPEQENEVDNIDANGVQEPDSQTTKQKKKKSKELEHISRTMMQAMSGLDSPDEKINAVCKKYAELTAEHRLLTNKFKVQQKQFHQLQREKDHLQTEHSKAVLAKSKLESLCRELQRHNKVVKDESIQRAKDEEEKRKELCAKFQQTINDITNQMQDNHAKNIKLKEENVELASKLKSLVEQYERREEHIEKMFKHKELELQLSDAKLQESGLNLAQEKERNLREKTVILTEAADYQRKCEALQAQEVQLKGQLAIYTEKFEEFQGTLTKSNEVFQQFKQEMDKMTKKIKKLEKETCTWKSRWETCNRSLLEMAEEKTIRDKEMLAQSNKIQKLEKLCRALQAERNALIGKTKAGSRSASSSPTPTPQPSGQSDPPNTGTQSSNEQPLSSDDRGPPEGATSADETIKNPSGDDDPPGDENSTAASNIDDCPDP
ncbi:alpha-taxilin-like isoform X2 [Ptychodera flava]|uniref:alpha-taxilin-like isoform X2 n=1 Tax=Ptychodera flava TaxID=63121 RepID=UPI00396A0C35